MSGRLAIEVVSCFPVLLSLSLGGSRESTSLTSSIKSSIFILDANRRMNGVIIKGRPWGLIELTPCLLKLYVL